MADIALGITGGVSAYKAVEIARGLQQAGHAVTAVMTRSARRFITPLTLEAITGREVVTDLWAPGRNVDIEHIALASRIDLLLVAPVTANTLAKFAQGHADDFLTAMFLATRAPVVLAPAMNSQMYAHPAVVQNLALLRERGASIVEPGSGYLACGWVGPGRLADLDRILAAVADGLRGPASPLTGRRVLITAGPTYEDIDPVRFIGNRASGRMGIALAAEAVRRGAQVTLVSGPSRVPPPSGADMVPVRSAADMHAAVLARASDSDVVIMAAAVADYTLDPAAQKIAKADGPLVLTLRRTRDILADVGALPSRAHGHPVLVGFAAETHDMIAHARGKLERKKADLIVANDVSRTDAGFDVDQNAVTLISATEVTDVPLQPKAQVARVILDRIERLLSPAPTA